MALTSTVCGTTSDSYVSLEEADTYFENHYVIEKGRRWAELTDPQQEHLLRVACQVIETLPFEDRAEYRQVYNQALQIPRNVDYVEGAYVIPQAFKDAQCEQAIYLLTLDESAMTAQMQGVWEESVQAGPVKVGNVFSGGGMAASMVAPLTFQILRPFIRRGSAQIRRA